MTLLLQSSTFLSLATKRLDKHDRYLDKLDRQLEKVEASITELRLEVQKGFHNRELKFQKILLQWLFRAAQLVSLINFTFLAL